MTISRPATVVQPLRIADATRSVRHVFIRDLLLTCSIGVHDFEKTAPQRVRINLDLAVREESRPLDDDIANVVCYEKISNGVRHLASTKAMSIWSKPLPKISPKCACKTQGSTRSGSAWKSLTCLKTLQASVLKSKDRH